MVSCGACAAVATAVAPCQPAHDDYAPGAIAETFSHAASLDKLGPSVISNDPYIVMFDNFASAAEVAVVSTQVNSFSRHIHYF